MKLNNTKYLAFVRDLAKRENEPEILYFLGALQGRLKKTDWQIAAKAQRDAKKARKAKQ